MEPFSLSSCMCMTQHTPIFLAGCLSWARPGRERSSLTPQSNLVPVWWAPWAPRAQPRAAVPWCAKALWTWHRYKFIFAVSQHRERMSFPQFHRLGSKEGKGKLKHPWLWGQCNQARQRFWIFLYDSIFYTAVLLSFSYNCPGFQVGTWGLKSDTQNTRNT